MHGAILDALSLPHEHSMNAIDAWLSATDNALRTFSGADRPARACPVPMHEGTELSDDERRLSASLMRVNHVGEVCAQALYNAQALITRDASLKAHLLAASKEETDHLAWTQQRLDELGARPSLLNPLWYAGAFGIGLVAARVSDAVSLGFVVETERQVERHLASHLDRLPAGDTASRAIVEQMKTDEAEHADAAQQAKTTQLPPPPTQPH